MFNSETGDQLQKRAGAGRQQLGILHKMYIITVITADSRGLSLNCSADRIEWSTPKTASTLAGWCPMSSRVSATQWAEDLGKPKFGGFMPICSVACRETQTQQPKASSPEPGLVPMRLCA